MVKFDNWFEVLTGTKTKAPEPTKKELFLDDDPIVSVPEA